MVLIISWHGSAVDASTEDQWNQRNVSELKAKKTLNFPRYIKFVSHFKVNYKSLQTFL